VRAAQYVRMSTDHQRYSTENQSDAIRKYAEERNIQVVRTYADEGKSGLKLEGRDALKRLIDDVLSNKADFETILVYDVSRWGRFQDADESAYHEHVCKRAGITVQFCAEQFENDGSPFSNMVKGFKRSMAGEYSRELSVKVFAGQSRLIELGYRQGGPPGYGLRRQLVNQTGQSKGVLVRGEHKSIQTDRVVLIPGPSEEVETVRWIYREFAEQGRSEQEIAAALNTRGVLSDLGRPWTRILPLKLIAEPIKKTPKYARIAASIREIGLVEPLVVARDRNNSGKFLLLDGHLRLEALKDMGSVEAMCLVSTDDEAFTYNRRINRLAIIQEHRMILKAIERGVPEERLARSLNIEIGTLQMRKSLLSGICAEAIDLLKDKDVAISTFAILRKMTPIRQIEAAELMSAMNQFSSTYATSLLVATSKEQLAEPNKPKALKGITNEQMELMERESANLEREFKLAAQSYGEDHLDFVLAKGYLSKLLSNARVVRHLAQHHQEFLSEFQQLVDVKGAGA
jgi:DNA invertase Pin-like site-specific DNA recombinase